MSFRVIVAGSKDWRDRGWIETVLSALLADHPDLVLAVTSAMGAPRHAQDWAATHPDHVTVDMFTADWLRLGRDAETDRADRLVKAGADLLLAFVRPCAVPWCATDGPHASHEASDVTTRARAAGVDVVEFREGWPRVDRLTG